MSRFHDLVAKNATVREAITITSSNIMKYFKLIQREIGAKTFILSDVKNGMWHVGFIHPRNIEGNLYILMKNKESGSKVSVAYAIGYMLSGSESKELLPDYHQLPLTVKKFSDLKMNMRILQNLKGIAKDAKVLASQFDPYVAPDLEKDINTAEIKRIQTSSGELNSEVFIPFEEDLVELGVQKIEFDIPKDINVAKNGMNITLIHPMTVMSRINIKIDSKVAYIVDFSKGSLSIHSNSKGNQQLDALIHTILGSYKFNVICYHAIETKDFRIKSDLYTMCGLIYSKMPSSLKDHTVLSFIFNAGQQMVFQIAEDKIAKVGYAYDSSDYFKISGMAGWVISDTFIESY